MKTNIFKRYMASNYRGERNFSLDNTRSSSAARAKIKRAWKKKARNEFNKDFDNE